MKPFWVSQTFFDSVPTVNPPNSLKTMLSSVAHRRCLRHQVVQTSSYFSLSWEAQHSEDLDHKTHGWSAPMRAYQSILWPFLTTLS